MQAIIRNRWTLPAVALIAGTLLLAPRHMARGAGAVLAVAGETAAVMAEKYEQRMRAAGIRLTSQDIKAIQSIEKHRTEMMELYRSLDRYQNAYQAKQNSTRTKQIDQHKAHLRLVQKQLPSTDATVGGYYMEVKRYLSGPSAKHTEYMKAIHTSLAQYAKEVKPADSPAAAAVASAAASRPAASPLEVYVISVSGDIEFYVNEQKVTRAKQSFPLNGKKVFTLRAVALDERRQNIRKFTGGGANTTVHAKGDYRLLYEVKSGNFRGATDWTVEDETYRWNVTREPNLRAQVEYIPSSKHLTLVDDVAVFTFDGVFSYGATVNGNVKWVGDSERPGGKRTMRNEGEAAGQIQLTVGPRG